MYSRDVTCQRLAAYPMLKHTHTHTHTTLSVEYSEHRLPAVDHFGILVCYPRLWETQLKVKIHHQKQLYACQDILLSNNA